MMRPFTALAALLPLLCASPWALRRVDASAELGPPPFMATATAAIEHKQKGGSADVAELLPGEAIEQLLHGVERRAHRGRGLGGPWGRSEHCCRSDGCSYGGGCTWFGFSGCGGGQYQRYRSGTRGQPAGCEYCFSCISACEDCPAGQYKGSGCSTATSCTACPAGMHSASGASSCTTTSSATPTRASTASTASCIYVESSALRIAHALSQNGCLLAVWSIHIKTK